MMSNESLIMISYLTLIVTICLTCSVSKIWFIKVFCLISLIGSFSQYRAKFGPRFVQSLKVY